MNLDPEVFSELAKEIEAARKGKDLWEHCSVIVLSKDAHFKLVQETITRVITHIELLPNFNSGKIQPVRGLNFHLIELGNKNPYNLRFNRVHMILRHHGFNLATVFHKGMYNYLYSYLTGGGIETVCPILIDPRMMGTKAVVLPVHAPLR